MTKFKFSEEYPFKTSHKVLFTYINTAGGLQQWFAESVNIDSEHNFNFEWDSEIHTAHHTSRLNKSSRFDFIGEDDGNVLEFKLIQGELDDSTYLKITDISDNDDEDELRALWDALIQDLKEIVGG